MIDAVLELVKLGSVGIVAGLFSSILANHDHRQRKWWEMRVGAYQNAIEALSDLVYYYDVHFNAEIEYRELSEDFKQKLNAYWEQSFPKVRKYADSGAFLFSDKANAALSELMTDDDEPTYFEHLDNNLTKARKCLNQLVECSKVDLKLKPSLLERLW
ncbi:hypothetical protein [Vogesella sp. LIG4]|uniref:hypothetical protein n=1 Tax=Vogesella sp. LIG4 TaxID=1192162 RepID=UPI00081FFE2F|nr:hypothetical protein [Vogesella sp. LIG4]SCK24050.1 hypothetical protein PSELUDRAFT_2819 [Vogesella sp. LIG4]